MATLSLLGCDGGTTADGGVDARVPGEDAEVAGDAGRDAGEMDVDAGADGGMTLEERFIAITIGTLNGATPEEQQAMHDAVASGGEEPSRGAGGVHHEAFLGTALLGTTEGQFLATDRWTNIEGARAIYGNPDFQAAFGAIFATPTQPELYSRSDFHEWGSLDAADAADPRYFVVVRGHLADEDVADSRARHDAVASGGQAMAMGAGDVAHIVFLGADDPRQFLALDVWTSSDNIEALYSNPDFMMALAPLFDAPPSIGVYESTHFHQW